LNQECKKDIKIRLVFELTCIKLYCMILLSQTDLPNRK